MGDRTARVGEASNPGPSGDPPSATAVDSSMCFETALEFGLTQRDSDTEVTTASCSETESCVEKPPVHRRLRLLWDTSVPDPSIQRHPEARAAEGLFQSLAAKVGSSRFRSAQGHPVTTLASNQRAVDLECFRQCSVRLVCFKPDCRTN